MDLTNLPETPPLRPFADPARIRMAAAAALEPPTKMGVVDAAEKFMFLDNAGGGSTGAYDVSKTPYLREPMDNMIRRDKQGLIFVGPPQSGKTQGLVLGAIGHSITCDPADTTVILPKQPLARDFSKKRVDKMLRGSPQMKGRLLEGGRADNVFDKDFQGMTLRFGSATINDLISNAVPRMLLSDVDRFADDIDDEGNAFDLALVRSRTFGSRGYTLAESSIGREVTDASWKPPEDAPHMAPPTTGILELYNRGDRRRWHWPCPQCGHFFEGDFKRLDWPKSNDIEESAQGVHMICPANGCIILPGQRVAMNERGIWVPDGCHVKDGRLAGTPPQSAFFSYWLKGPGATWVMWPIIVRNWLNAERQYDLTGREGSRKTTVQVDQGNAYIPKAAEAGESLEASTLIKRAEKYELKRVPDGCRFITVGVDVQKYEFRCLARGWGENMESWVLDYWRIFKSADPNRPIEPALFAEDWDLLFHEVAFKTFEMGDQAGRLMQVVRMCVDSSGVAGTTSQAYSFQRRCQERDIDNRIWLYRGEPRSHAQRFRVGYPDAERKDRHAAARGEVPVLFCNPNLLKDELDAALRKKKPGPLFVHLSEGLKEGEAPHPFFEELTAEKRQPDGKWEKRRTRNEALDCMVMAHAAALSLGIDRIDWDEPPDFAEKPAENPYVVTPEQHAQELLEFDAEPVEEEGPSEPSRSPTGYNFVKDF